MLTLLVLALIIGLLQALSCPAQYQLMQGRCIRPLILNTGNKIILDNEMPGYREECAKDGAHLPIIKNDEENIVFDNIANSFDEIRGQAMYIILDLTCNSVTHRLEWIDGSKVNYSRWNSVNFDFDCVGAHETVVSRPYQDDWFLVPTNKAQFWYTVLCDYDGMVSPTEKPIDEQCGEYSMITSPTDDKKPCFKIFSNPISWELAQQQCAADFGSLVTINSVEENKFFWRTAISNNFLEGMHIGAHQSNESPSKWTWIDGEVPFDGKTYSNFVSFFPVPGAGECSSMATESTAAQWVNEDCHANEQPFICRRSDFSNVPKACPTDPMKVGEDFFPPGFPNSDISCEYYLIVAAKKLVKLEVITLVAQDNKDFLEILEGTSGPHLLANLTGTIRSTAEFTTTESNVMRVSWKPSGSGSGRGFRIRFNEIDQ